MFHAEAIKFQDLSRNFSFQAVRGMPRASHGRNLQKSRWLQEQMNKMR